MPCMTYAEEDALISLGSSFESSIGMIINVLLVPNLSISLEECIVYRRSVGVFSFDTLFEMRANRSALDKRIHLSCLHPRWQNLQGFRPG